METKTKIKKVTILSQGLEVDLKSTTYAESGAIASNTPISLATDIPVHNDLLAVLERMKYHLARGAGLLLNRAEETEVRLKEDKDKDKVLDMISRVTVKSVTYDLDDESETPNPSIQIQGIYRDQWDGKKQPVSFGNLFLESSKYPFANDLVGLLEQLNDEVSAYLFQSKFGDGAQLQLFAMPQIAFLQVGKEFSVYDDAEVVSSKRGTAEPNEHESPDAGADDE